MSLNVCYGLHQLKPWGELNLPLGLLLDMQTNINSNQFIDAGVDFHENSEGLVIEKYQEIPQSFIDGLRAEKANSKSVREGEMQRVASIPVVVVDKWIAEGFDFQNATAKQILAKLRMENLDAFITTEKQV